MTGIILAMARAIGEAAPLLLIGGVFSLFVTSTRFNPLCPAGTPSCPLPRCSAGSQPSAGRLPGHRRGDDHRDPRPEGADPEPARARHPRAPLETHPVVEDWTHKWYASITRSPRVGTSQASDRQPAHRAGPRPAPMARTQERHRRPTSHRAPGRRVLLRLVSGRQERDLGPEAAITALIGLRLRQVHPAADDQPDERPGPGLPPRRPDPARRGGPLRQGRRPGRGPSPGRDGVPEAKPVPEDDLRERAFGPGSTAIKGDWTSSSSRACGVRRSGTTSRTAQAVRYGLVGRTAATTLYRAGHRHSTGRDPHG